MAQEGEPPETGFGDKGHFAISGERMFGYSQATTKATVASGTSTTTTTSISLLGVQVGGVATINDYTFPRIAFDAFVAPSVSVGGSATYFRVSSAETASGTTGSFNTTISGFLLAPRLGFAVRVAPSVWIWPRAGITYVRLSSRFGSDGPGDTTDLFAATVEAPVAITLGPNAFATIGPTVDIGLAGSNTSNSDPSPSVGMKESELGLQAGFVVYL